MNLLAPASVLLLTFSGVGLAAEKSATDHPKDDTATAKSIGMARMLADGTIMVGVPGPGSGERAEAVLMLKPGDTQYKPLLDHVGGLKPGETKSIPPWPDPPSPSHSNEAPPPAPPEN